MLWCLCVCEREELVCELGRSCVDELHTHRHTQTQKAHRVRAPRGSTYSLPFCSGGRATAPPQGGAAASRETTKKRQTTTTMTKQQQQQQQKQKESLYSEQKKT